jgi:hypothetical protein
MLWKKIEIEPKPRFLIENRTSTRVLRPLFHDNPGWLVSSIVKSAGAVLQPNALLVNEALKSSALLWAHELGQVPPLSLGSMRPPPFQYPIEVYIIFKYTKRSENLLRLQNNVPILLLVK